MNAAIKGAASAVCALGLVISVAGNPAEAGKGPRNRASATWTAQGKASPVVRDHRGEGQVRPPPALTKRKGVYVHCTTGRTTTCRPLQARDHRGPRVVPKEDPPQKW